MVSSHYAPKKRKMCFFTLIPLQNRLKQWWKHSIIIAVCDDRLGKPPSSVWYGWIDVDVTFLTQLFSNCRHLKPIRGDLASYSAVNKIFCCYGIAFLINREQSHDNGGHHGIVHCSRFICRRFSPYKLHSMWYRLLDLVQWLLLLLLLSPVLWTMYK